MGNKTKQTKVSALIDKASNLVAVKCLEGMDASFPGCFIQEVTAGVTAGGQLQLPVLGNCQYRLNPNPLHRPHLGIPVSLRGKGSPCTLARSPFYLKYEFLGALSEGRLREPVWTGALHAL